MSFLPLLPAGGPTGYALLTRTESAQRAVFDRKPEIERDVAAFRERIGEVDSAAALVADRQLLRVALGAFGLDDEIGKIAFIRRILEEPSADPASLSNRLVDPRYRKLAAAFGFGDIPGGQTAFAGFADRIAAAYKERSFEVAVGDQNADLRLALNFRREIAAYAAAADPEGTAWFSVMGDRPVRAVFEAAFGLPESFGKLDIDRQRDTLRSLNRREFGGRGLDVFADPERVETVINRFLARRAAEAGPTPSTPGFAALSILSARSTGVGGATLTGLLTSA